MAQDWKKERRRKTSHKKGNATIIGESVGLGDLGRFCDPTLLVAGRADHMGHTFPPGLEKLWGILQRGGNSNN